MVFRGDEKYRQLGRLYGRHRQCVCDGGQRGWVIGAAIFYWDFLAVFPPAGLGETGRRTRGGQEAGTASVVVWRRADGYCGSLLRNLLFRPESNGMVVPPGDDFRDYFGGAGGRA